MSAEYDRCSRGYRAHMLKTSMGWYVKNKWFAGLYDDNCDAEYSESDEELFD